MKKVIKLIISFVFIIVLASGIFVSNQREVKGAEIKLPDRYVFTYESKDYNDGETIPVSKSSELPLLIRGKMNNDGTSWEINPDSISWFVENDDVVVGIKEVPGSKDDRQRIVAMKGPGISTVNAIIQYNDAGNGKPASNVLTARFKVNLAINRRADGVSEVNNERIIVLDFDELGAYEQRQIHIDNFNNPNEIISLRWTSSNQEIAKVTDTETSKGMVSAVGSGSTEVKVETTNKASGGEVLEDKIRVVVIPQFNVSLRGQELGKSLKTNMTNPKSVGGTPIMIDSSSFEINSNALKATNLKWEVLDQDGKKASMILEPHEHDGTVEVKNAKAGNYTIFAYSDDRYKGRINHAAMNIVIPIKLNDKSILMNVGDYYNILNNSTIPDFKDVQMVIGDQTILERQSNPAEIKAIRSGKTTITVTAIDDKYKDENGRPFNAIIDVEVIDGISLSVTDARLAVGSSLRLNANVTKPVGIKWSSSDPTVAKVSDDGVVTGMKPSGDKPVIITATVNINGVEKKATAKIEVVPSVTKIEITPANVILDIGKEQILSAKITPVIKGTELIWQSTNNEIVEVVEVNGLIATIKAKKAGTATITAINKDNIVVGYSYITVNQPVTSITLSATELKLNVGTSNYQLRATVLPADATNKKVKWTSQDPSIATIDANGIIRAIKAGKVTIYATAEDNKDIVAQCNLTVVAGVSSVSFTRKEISINIGRPEQLSYTVLPAEASNKSVVFTSLNPAIANVDATGRVTGISVGMTIIAVKTVDGNFVDYCTVFVGQLPTGLTLDVQELNLRSGQSQTIKALLTPSNSTSSFVIWESIDPRVATVDANGKVIAVDAGKTIITAKLPSGASAYCVVNVRRGVDGVTMSHPKLTLNKGEKFTLKAIIAPVNASDTKLRWESSDVSVAIVNENGQVTAISPGAAIITVRTLDGNYEAISLVTVKELTTSIKLNHKTYRLGIKKSFTLKATLSKGTTNKKVRWTSSNPRVATVNQNGKVTAKAYGYTTIRATTLDGSNKSAVCEVRVVKPVTSVAVNKAYLSMTVGKTATIKATIRPTSATYKTPKWSSSDTEVAVVDSKGKVTALKPGKAIITATAKDNSGKKAMTTVEVRERIPATGITPMDKKVVMIKGEQKSVKVVTTPLNTSDGYSWSSNNSSVARVDKKTGRIVARSTGDALITVMTDSGAKATIEVVVVGLSRASLKLEQYDKYNLFVDGATNVRWDSSNQKVATVNNRGEIITRGTGTTDIIATVNGRRLVCKVKVTKIS